MRDTKHYRPLLAMSLVVLIAAGASQAATLRFVVFCDTLDPSIGTIKDLSKATTWAHNIASYTGLALDLRTLSGAGLTPANARHMLNALDPSSDDVVYFTYSGHGANLGHSQWPAFALLTETNDPPLTFDEVVSILQPKPQRMLVVLADCCNVNLSSSSRVKAPSEPAGQSTLTATNFRHLFLDFSGSILATAASVGQYSFGSESEGGLFLDVFMNDFSSLAAGTPDLSWEQVLSTTGADVNRTAADYIATGAAGNIQPQQPYYVIDAEQVAGSTPALPDSSDPASSTDSTSNGSSGDISGDASDTGAPAAPSASRCGATGAIIFPAICLGLALVNHRRRARTR